MKTRAPLVAGFVESLNGYQDGEVTRPEAFGIPSRCCKIRFNHHDIELCLDIDWFENDLDRTEISEFLKQSR